MTLPWLTPEEVQALTDRRQPAAQIRVLQDAKPRISFKVVGGRPIVPRTEVMDTVQPSVKLNLD